MATQTVEFSYSPGETLTLKLFADGSDTVADSGSATGATNREGVYSVAFTDLPAGVYRAVLFSGTTSLATGWVEVAASTGTYHTTASRQPRGWLLSMIDGFNWLQAMRLVLAAVSGKLSGANSTTVTIRAADDGKDRITATVDDFGNRSAVTLDGDD